MADYTDYNETDPENADPFRPRARYPGSRRHIKRQTAAEAALDARAAWEYAQAQLDALDLPPPEAFAAACDPPEPPFDPSELAEWLGEDPPETVGAFCEAHQEPMRPMVYRLVMARRKY
jgi:hypothetical protein